MKINIFRFTDSALCYEPKFIYNYLITVNLTNFLLTNKTFLIEEGSEKADDKQAEINSTIAPFFAGLVTELDTHMALQQSYFESNASSCVQEGFNNAYAECEANVAGISNH